MRFGVLSVRAFAAQSLCRGEPALRGQPIAIVEGKGRTAAITQVSRDARGIEPGMGVALAMARCPSLVIRGRSEAAEREAQALLVAAGFGLSPHVEDTEPGVCSVDLRGEDPRRTRASAERMIAALELEGLSVGVGFAGTPWIAAIAASTAAGILEVSDAASLLAPLPLALAKPTAAQAALLARWGVRTLGALSRLPVGEIGERLGPEGVALWERASGRAERALALTTPAEAFAVTWTYETPIETLEPLRFILRRFCDGLAARLAVCHLAASELALELALEGDARHERRFRLPEPNRDADAWLRVVDAHLQTVRCAERVVGVTLAAAPTRPSERQDGLFDTGLADPHCFFENLARVAAVVGTDRVGAPEMDDTHRPDAVRRAAPPSVVPAPVAGFCHARIGLHLRRFRPPRPIEVKRAAGRPQRLVGEVCGNVVACQGPWRLSGEWWLPTAWSLERWQVALETGGVYQILRGRKGWAVEGALG